MPNGTGGQSSLDYPNGMQYFRIAVIGAGAAAPTLPVGAAANLSATPDFPTRANAISRAAAEIPTRSAVGVYAIQYDKRFLVPKVLKAVADVYGVAGMWAAITSVNAATRTINVTTYVANGTATDLTTSMMLVIEVEAMDTNT